MNYQSVWRVMTTRCMSTINIANVIGYLSSGFDQDDVIRVKANDVALERLRKDQQYNYKRSKVLGEELSAAHFIVARGGSVKFYGNGHWFRKDADGKLNIPNRKVEGLTLEAVDASGTGLMYEGLENFEYLECLKYFSVSRCPKFDDFCVNRLQYLAHNLEYLDLSGCPLITENGLSCLHHLKALRFLKIADLPRVKDIELMTLLIEEVLPNCIIVGVDQEKINKVLLNQNSEELLKLEPSDSENMEQNISQNSAESPESGLSNSENSTQNLKENSTDSCISEHPVDENNTQTEHNFSDPFSSGKENENVTKVAR